MALELNCTDDGRVQFQGLFEDLQMGPLLLWILEEQQQGELTITTEGLQQVIYFAHGYPVGTRGGPPENFLGWILREKGYIDDSMYLHSLQRMAEAQQLQGQILLQMGAINEQQLREALLLQLQRKLIRLFRPIEGEFYFLSAAQLPIIDIEIGALNPYTVTANAVRQEFHRERLEHSLDGLNGYAIRLEPDSQWQTRIDYLQLEDDERAALTLLEDWNTVERFVYHRYLDTTPSKVLISLLFSTNLLELEELEEHPHLIGSISNNTSPSHVSHAAPSTPPPYFDEGVSIRVETAKRPGPAPDPNAPRKRASVTVHLKEDRIETHSEIQRIPPQSTSFASPPHHERTDPSLVGISLELDESLEAPLFGDEIGGEFIPPQQEDVKTDPSLLGVNPNELRSTPPAQNQAVIAGPPPAAARPAARPAPRQAPTSTPAAPAAVLVGGPPGGNPAHSQAARPAPRAQTRPTPAASAHPPQAQAARPAPPRPAASTPAAQAAAPPPGNLSPEDQAHRDAILKKKKMLDKASYYQILEVEPNASAEQIRKSYYAQSRTFHPDRVAGTPLEALKQDLDVIFSRLNEAYSILSNAEEKAEYDRKLLDPEAAALEEQAPIAAQAEVFFSKANVFIKKKDFTAAEEQLQWACKLIPEEGDFQATLAWAIYNNPQRDRKDAFQKAIFHLENAHQSSHVDRIKLHQYWGNILKQEQDFKGAVAQFNELLKLNPRHVDAQREVRNLNAQLRNIRDQAKEEEKKSAKGGLFGFLKK